MSATQVASVTEPGRYNDGLGLYLQVTPSSTGEGVTKAWLFRYTLHGRHRHMGLGAYPVFSLKDARERANRARQMLADGLDPLAAKRASRAELQAEAGRAITFQSFADDYIAKNASGWKNPKHRDQWRATLAAYAYPKIGTRLVSEIETGDVLRVIEPIWTEKRETASRLRGRIERILAAATVKGFRTGDNPARWRGHLKEALPGAKPKQKQFPSLPYAQLPTFITDLRRLESISALALEFTILTTARTGEVIGATWGEIDLENALWRIPGERMKAEADHLVTLNERAMEILKSLRREGQGDGYVFPGARAGKGLSNMAMLMLLKGMKGREGLTVHGFRRTFKDWAREETSFENFVSEMALAHTVKGVEGHYTSADLVKKRRALMDSWGAFCGGCPVPTGDGDEGEARA
ncbi:MAG: integrase arm-type DNA-binding domain-containing protein [Oceanicaulis sp.]|nr:integrase arm-type DNA-binding domain-containing protein [Oceanicaulis sp.]